ncbi:hypothetical protein PVAND_011488 [Polypedilum vanderplanki]|uniref:Peptidase M14 domain-containing protein n=1 Tax=Polypedilum vanderplanki TaxID=319348 RepID=A0A9J6CJG7_POLVA|nr:hypothetical protein PVAND_011488 [Polypedilum vanderplanki]
MVPQSITIFLLIFRINFPCVLCVSSTTSSFFPSVIINNKPVSFRDGVINKSKENSENIRNNLFKYNITQQKSNIYKPTNFITSDRFKYGLITKDNFKWYYPKETHIVHNSIRATTDKSEISHNYYDSFTTSSTTTTTSAEQAQESFLSAMTSPVPPISYDDDIDLTENENTHNEDTYNNEDEELQYSIVPIQTTPTTQGTLQSLSFAFSTPTPATIVITPSTSISSHSSSANNHNKGDNNNKKGKKKKKKVTTSPQIHKHFIENLDYYRKILQINCTGNLANNNTRQHTTTFADSNGSSNTVVVTPKPNRVKNNDKYIKEAEEQKDKDDYKDDKKKCKCKKKHHHHHSHEGHHHHHGHHHHKGSKESHEHKPSYYAKPQAVVQHTIPVQTIHTIPETHTFNHIHQHKHVPTQVVPQIIPIKTPVPSVTVSRPITSYSSLNPEKIEYFDTSRLPPAPLGEEYEEVGSMFGSFYKAIENAFTTSKEEDQEGVDYQSRDDYTEETEESESEAEEEEEVIENDDDSEEEDESDEDYKKRKKRDLLTRKTAAAKLENKLKKMRTKKQARDETKTKLDESESESESEPETIFDVLSNLFITENANGSKKMKKKKPKKNYANHQLWRLFLKSKKNVAYMEKFIRTEEGRKFHWLNIPRAKRSMDVVVLSDLSKSFRKYLDEGEIHYNVEVYNIQHAMKLENPRFRRKDGINERQRQMPAERYYTVRDHHAYYKLLKQNYPNFLELIEIGRSTNNMPLVIATISYKTRKNSRYETKRKPAIFIQSGSSPHLWNLIASSNYILKYLLMHITDDDSFGKVIRKFDWYIFGIANPDGLEYSMSYDRLWQKTRSQHENKTNKSKNIMMSTFSWFIENSPQKPCYGVHYSRNFDSHWKNNKALSNNNQCSDFYEGQFPSSEPEVKSLSDFLMRHQSNIQLFINLEGYGQQILFPTLDLDEDAVSDLNDMARAGLRNIKMHRSADNKYEISKNDSYIDIGTPESFAMYKAKIKYSYRIEGSETLHQSIFIPIKSIEKTANEILDIIKGMVKYLENE